MNFQVTHNTIKLTNYELYIIELSFIILQMEFIKCYEFVKFMYIITFKSLLDLVRSRKEFISSDNFIDNFSKIVEIYACFFELYFIYSQ